MRQLTYLSFFLLIGFRGFSQQFLTGKVRKSENQEILSSVSIYNRAERTHKLSDEQGNYRIVALPGDTILFSAVGFKPDTILVTGKMLGVDFPVLMDARSVSLEAVTVGSQSNYERDSLERREVYAWIYEQTPQPVVEKQRQGDGVGVELNVIPHGSSEVRQRLQLKKRIIKEEQKYYVNFRFSADYITRLTHLEGAQLQQFMERYRPTYEFCRGAANVDMLVYINDSYKKFEGKQ